MNRKEVIRSFSDNMEKSLQSKYVGKKVNDKMWKQSQKDMAQYLNDLHDKLFEPYFDCKVVTTEEDIKDRKMAVNIKYGTRLRKDIVE